jgi:hypothetical protein
MPNVLQPSLSNTPTSKQEDTITGIAPYTEDLLKRGQAFSTAETPVYKGQLTSGPAKYESEAWKGLANLALPENSKFNTAAAQQYMNPYIEASLNPQLELQRRQAIINLQPEMTRLTQAGGFGGSRQAVLQGLAQENLLRQQAATTGAEYEKAYNAALAQFNADQGNQRSNLTALSTAGGTQHDREQAALDAQYNEWLRQTKYPKEQLEEQKGLISALAPTLPKTQVLYGQKQSALQQLTAGTAALSKFAKDLGYKDITDMAKATGLSLDKLKSVFGISSNPTGSVKNETDLSKLTPEELQKLNDQENPGGVDLEKLNKQENPDIVAPPESTEPDIMIDPREAGGFDMDGYGEEFSLAAEGGLVGMLQKMRGYK